MIIVKSKNASKGKRNARGPILTPVPKINSQSGPPRVGAGVSVSIYVCACA